MKAVKLLVASLSSSRGFITFHYSGSLRPIATTSTTSAAAATKSASNYHFHITRTSSTSTYIHSKMNSEHFTFGPYKISHKEVFYSTDLSYAMVNLRPVIPERNGQRYARLLPGFMHSDAFIDNDVLSNLLHHNQFKREVKRFVDLTAEETSDLWLTAQKVGSQLENYHKASSLTLNIQDGPQAGQTVPHVHIHILPRKSGDFENNDEIYDAIDVKEKEVRQKLDVDKERTDRSLEEMTEEADEYRRLLS